MSHSPPSQLAPLGEVLALLAQCLQQLDMHGQAVAAAHVSSAVEMLLSEVGDEESGAVLE